LAGGKPAQWKSVERVSDTDLVALDSRGRLSRFQYRTEPVAGLSEVVSKNLEKPSDTGVISVASRIAFADVDGVVHFLDAGTLDRVATHKLPTPAVGRLRSAGSLVAVETRDHQLSVFDATGSTKPVFVANLGQSGLSGPIALIHGRLIIA